jgi:hypothetical protein
MNDGIVESEIGLIYSLLLPDQIQVALNLYWGEAPLLDKLAQSEVRLVPYRLRDELFGEGGPIVRELPDWQRVGVELGAQGAQCILLHHVLDNPAVTVAGRSACRSSVMRLCKEVLAPCGVVVIGFSNRWSVGRLRGAAYGAALHFGASTRKADLSLWRCRRLARRAGLRVGDAFAVIPSLERPTAMISTRGDAAKVFYSRGRTQLLDKLPHWASLENS